MNLQSLKERPGLWLIAGSMITSAPRYVGAFALAEGFRVISPLWDAIHAASGLGMAVLEAVAVWYCATSLSRYGKRDAMSVLLAGLIVAMFVCLAWTVAPYIMASTQKLMIISLLDTTGLWAWSFALTLAPLVVMAASGIAEHLSTHRQPIDNLGNNLSIQLDEVVSRLATLEQRETTSASASVQVVNMAATTTQPIQPVAQPDTQLVVPVAQLPQPDALKLSDEALAAQLVAQPDATNAQLARLFGVSGETIRKRRRTLHTT